MRRKKLTLPPCPSRNMGPETLKGDYITIAGRSNPLFLASARGGLDDFFDFFRYAALKYLHLRIPLTAYKMDTIYRRYTDYGHKI